MISPIVVLSEAVLPARNFLCHEDTKPRRLHEEHQLYFLLRELRGFVARNGTICGTAAESGLSKRVKPAIRNVGGQNASR
jgi:hypothetical protein